ncbi:MAG: Hsp20/alpha crystallin family protein [Acidobacteria bacterium]|nr:Hsp20/alpha crystallin family protein [Acidobacteriota bacterium]
MEKEVKALEKIEKAPEASPLFVDVEKMFERSTELFRDIGSRAFEFFQDRGHMIGTQLDDWFRAESEILRPTPVEITENETTITLKAAVPGFRPDEIEVSVKGDKAFISGRSGTELKSEDEKTFYSEWKSDRFHRELTLPSLVDEENVKAELKDGILTLAMIKRAEKEATKVAVKTA